MRRLCLSMAGILGLACAGAPMPPRAAPAEPTVLPSGPIVVIGDTQRTSWGEQWLFFEAKCLTLDAPCPGGVLERFSVALPAR